MKYIAFKKDGEVWLREVNPNPHIHEQYADIVEQTAIANARPLINGDPNKGEYDSLELRPRWQTRHCDRTEWFNLPLDFNPDKIVIPDLYRLAWEYIPKVVNKLKTIDMETKQSTILIQDETSTVLNMVDNFDGTFGIIIPHDDGLGGATLTTEQAENLRDYLIQVLGKVVKEINVIDLSEFCINLVDVERAFCFGYLSNPDNNCLDNVEMMKRWNNFKDNYLEPIYGQ